MTIGEKIRKMRMLRDYTQAQLGSKVHLTGDRIRQYENDVRSPKEGKLQEIADALDVNVSAIDNPDLEHPASVMHSFFELEEHFGLHVEKINDDYHLVLSQVKDPGEQDILIEFLDGWYHERSKYQPSLNDSPEDVEKKKKDYEIWKARFPYNMYDRINAQFDIVTDFMNLADKLLDVKRTPITRFSELFQHLIDLGNSGLNVIAKHDDRFSTLCATFTIKCSDILNLKGDSKILFAEFRRDLFDLKDMGFYLEEEARQINNETYAFYEINSPQIATLCTSYNKLMDTKKSPSYNEDFYKMELAETMRNFNVPINEYIPADNTF